MPKEQEVKEEMLRTKKQLKESFAETSLNVKNLELTKEDLAYHKEKTKGLPDALKERYKNTLRIDKVLRIIEGEKKIQERLDSAISFLDMLIEESKATA